MSSEDLNEDVVPQNSIGVDALMNLQYGASEDDVLRASQALRRDILAKAFANGVPDIDDKSIYKIQTLLQDLDNNALSLKKIKAEENTAESNNNIALAAARIAEQMGRTMTATQSGEVKTVSDSQLPEVEILEGEMSCGDSGLTYEAFMAQKEAESTSGA